jgi:hypothetical protein
MGLVLALFALVWGRWTSGPLRERLFSAEEQQVLAHLSVEEQRAEVERVEGYRGLMQRSLSAERDHNSPRFFYLTNEKERTERRLDRARRELDRRNALAGLRTEQLSRMKKQGDTDRARGDAMTVLGLSLAVVGCVLWYLRRQRHLDSPLRLASHEEGIRERSSP